MNSNKIAVLGSNGQLGKCIQKLVPEYEWDYEFIFADSATVDITDKDSVLNFSVSINRIIASMPLHILL